MTGTRDKYHRRSIRLKRYDYSRAGFYFVTICTQNRECLFGDIVDGKMLLNDIGKIVALVWHDLPTHYPHVLLDVLIIMPNHAHAVIGLESDGTGSDGAGSDGVGSDGVGSDGAGSVRAGLKPAPTTRRRGLPEIVRAWKTFSSRRINETLATPGVKIWQRNYYEHVVRNEEDLNRIRQYVVDNPSQWEMDRENPHAIRTDATITKGFWELGV